VRVQDRAHGFEITSAGASESCYQVRGRDRTDGGPVKAGVAATTTTTKNVDEKIRTFAAWDWRRRSRPDGFDVINRGECCRRRDRSGCKITVIFVNACEFTQSRVRAADVASIQNRNGFSLWPVTGREIA
jgi:hypothetical protein